jgi:Asp-tRNA(Asn)/Glu-tRNA(Gln) amidotransferase A subunit family amidase
MPGGFSTPTSEAPIGVPVGFELLGLPESERHLIAISSQYEKQFPKRKAPIEANWL